MYAATVHTLVKALGADTLIGVPNLVVADYTSVSRVVVKKEKRWLFQSPKYYVTEFKLNQILIDSEKLDVEVKQSTLVEYHQNKEFDIKGEIGAKLCAELLDVSLNINDRVILTAKCGAICKQAIDVPLLMDLLKNKNLDFHHPLVKQVREDSRRVLCVVTEVVYLENEGLIHSKVDTKKSASFKASFPAGQGTGKLEASGEYDEEKDKAFKIPAGTPLAYAVCELVISKTGRIELVVVDGAHGGFGAFDDPDSCDVSEAVNYNITDIPVNEMFEGFVSLPSYDRDDCRQVIHTVMYQTKLVKPLLKQMKRAFKSIDGTIAKTTTMDILRHDISSDSCDWKPFLSLSGFLFSTSNEVVYPAEKTVMLESCRCLLEALYELDDDLVMLLRKRDQVIGTALVALLRHSVFSTNSLDIDRPGLSPLIKAKDLMAELKFTITDNIVVPPKWNKTIQASYNVIYALWGV